jgi:biopolymer transport protein ExbD
MGAGYGNPPKMFEPPAGGRPPGGPVRPPTAGKKHRRWIVHSHEATQPAHSGSMSDINITPLIDVLLVLLIIFMVVTPLTQKGLDIALPQASTQPQQQQQQSQSNQVVLGLDETGMTVNKSPVGTMDELNTRLRDIFQTRTDKTMFVRASGKVLYGKVVEAMDIAKGAGVERIGIISEKMIEDAGGVVDGAPVPGAAPPGQ